MMGVVMTGARITEGPEIDAGDQHEPEAVWWRSIYNAGAASRRAGGLVSDCPRQPFTMSAVIWLSGFTGSSVASQTGTA
jgi:hypothetical protein